MKFTVRASGPAGVGQTWTTEGLAHGGDLSVAIPPEFDGPGGGFSPEDFYALALENCFVATFKVFAEKSRLEYTSLDSEGILTVDRDEAGKPWMAAFTLNVKLIGARNSEAARRLLERTSQNCLILNSVRTPVTFNFDVTEQASSSADARSW